MYSVSNQPGKIYGTAKTHKFEHNHQINVTNLKFRLIIDQAGTYLYNAAKVISNYLKPLTKNQYSIRDTQSFPTTIKSLPSLKEDEEDVSYDVESLFTNIPVQEIIEYIINQIYVYDKIKPICNKLIFKRLLLKITTEVSFTIEGNFFKQIDGCTMGGPLSVTLSDIFMVKMENEIVSPINPIFYQRYVDDIYCRRKKDRPDQLFEKLNSYNKNIKLTIEKSPEKFLDTKLILSNGKYTTEVYRNDKKVPIPWTSKVPKRYKRNTITGDLHRSKQISSDFNKEVTLIREKFSKADYPIRFVDSVIKQFQQKCLENDIEDDMIIPKNLFEEEKPLLLLEVPFCPENENKSKHFIKKFHHFTKESYKLNISWKTKKVRSFFRVKDKTIYPACQIYHGICECGKDYVGETERNTITRWAEHNNPRYNSEPAKHLQNNVEHKFDWKTLCQAPKNKRIRKNLEAIYISLLRPSLNEQNDFNRLTLFRNGIT